MSGIENIAIGYFGLCDLLEGIGEFPSENIFNKVRKHISQGRRRIFFGTGRSGDIADVAAKFLRNIGFNETYGPADIPYIFEENDLLVTFSGSGATTLTVETAKIAREAGAKVIGFTSNPNSPLGDVSTITVKIPGKTGMGPNGDYHGRQLLGVSRSPLTPLGTLYELRSLVLTLSLIDSFNQTETKRSYVEICKLLRGYAPSDIQFELLYKLIPKPESKVNPLAGKTVVIGEGFSGAVGKFFVTRLRHCAKADEERECYFYTDKGSISVKEGDMTLVISGSGESIPALLAKKAREKGVTIAAITSKPQSSLAKNAHVNIIIPGREVEKVKGLRSSYLPRDPRKSIFELRALLSLESFIHFIADKEGVSEEDMETKHSDFT